MLTASLFIAGLTYLLVPLVSQALLLALVAFLLGIGLGCAQPLTIILTYNHAPAGRSGEALGMRLTVNKLTQIVVPLVFGGIGSAFGLFPVFWANGAFLLAGGVVSLAERRVIRRKDPPPRSPNRRRRTHERISSRWPPPSRGRRASPRRRPAMPRAARRSS